MPFSKGPFGGGGGMGVISGSGELVPGGLSRIREAEEKKARDKKERVLIDKSRRVRKQDAMQRLQFADAIRARKLKEFEKTTTRLGGSAAQFVRPGISQEQPFSQEQEALHQMFGGGVKFWGANDPVHINYDLNPSRRGDRGTADVFGFGGNGERAGLF